MIFLDTSVIIAYYLPESYSAEAQSIYQAHPNPTISSLIEVEAVSVLARLVRLQSLTPVAARQIAAIFAAHLEQGLYTRLPLHLQHYQQAHSWITHFDLPLKAPDALHLAAAHLERLQLVTADRQLARNADSLGIAVDLLTA